MIYELRNIIDTYQALDFSERKAVLATVVGLKGSGYRRPGARMLILDNGLWVGAISGGCLEGDALRKAREVMQSGQPRLVVYDTTRPDDNFGIGLGCHGILDVLLEPLEPTDPQNPLTALNQLIQQRRVSEWSQVLPDGERFTQTLVPDVQLLVFGGGYDAVPLVSQAKMLGWRVVVADDCVAHLTPKRFGSADELINVDRNRVREQVPIDAYSAAVLISHNYGFDRAILNGLLQTDIPYIGILGPKKRGDALLEEVSESIDPADLERVFAPIGLDIGGENPAQIALSITAEIQAVFSGHSGQSLRTKDVPIHQPNAVEAVPFVDSLTVKLR